MANGGGVSGATVALVAVLVLGVGGAVAYVLYSRRAEAAEGAPSAMPPEAGAAAATGDVGAFAGLPGGALLAFAAQRAGQRTATEGGRAAAANAKDRSPRKREEDPKFVTPDPGRSGETTLIRRAGGEAPATRKLFSAGTARAVLKEAGRQETILRRGR